MHHPPIYISKGEPSPRPDIQPYLPRSEGVISRWKELRLFFLLALCIFITLPLQAQKIFRRHFLVAYDVSTPFVNAQQETEDYEQAIVALFSNQNPTGAAEAQDDNLLTEKKNGLKFFDAKKDEISFYHFNVSKQEMNGLHWVAENKPGTLVDAFNKVFIKDKNLNWSDYRKKNGEGSLKEYVHTMLQTPANPGYFGKGVSMTSFVFPLILNQVDTSQYAGEYILIVLSDFKTGSDLGNKEDLKRIRDIFWVDYQATLPANSPVTRIEKSIDHLSSKYYKIDYFQYAFPGGYLLKDDSWIAIIGSKIKPKAGYLNPEDLSVFIDGDLGLNQHGYRSQDFDLLPTRIKFTHNQALKADRLQLKITAEKGPHQQVLFDDTVATRTKDGRWISHFSDDDHLMRFDSARVTYQLPEFHLRLDSSINHKDFDNLKVTYAFGTHYQVSAEHPLNLVFTAERNLAPEQIDYSTKATIIIMYYLIPAILIIGIILLLIHSGKPRSMEFSFDGYIDSLVKIEKNTGRLETAYLAWSYDKSPDYFPVNGQLNYRKRHYPFNWDPTVICELTNVSLPDGFEIVLKPNRELPGEFAEHMPMAIRKNSNNELIFHVGLIQTDSSVKIPDLEKIAFVIQVKVKHSVLFFSADLALTIDYQYHIGPELGDVWVAFDPGTSGSCAAIASTEDNIMMGSDINNKHIIPSVLAFETVKPLPEFSGAVPEDIYRYGTYAYPMLDNNNFRSFQSIKKQLGYNNVRKIEFKNGKQLSMKGKDLASLLIKGLYRDLKHTLAKDASKSAVFERGEIINPLRAVIAIPNNFTLPKILEITQCVKDLGQFIEVRTVYEAEAILFYYLANFKRFNPVHPEFHAEAVLVFDMGGATINATVVTTKKVTVRKRLKYEINYLGKIGYGIGGDSIDYCISKFLQSFPSELPVLKRIPLDKERVKFTRLAFQIKTEIITNYRKKEKALIGDQTLERLINEEFNLTETVNEQGELFRHFKRDVNGLYPLFSHPLFRQTVYDNVTDSVNEVMSLSNHIYTDKIIFSGRSSGFPLIRETVLAAMNGNANSKIGIVELDLEESKTAVVRGACWYGVSRNAVILNNLKTNASFGFKRTDVGTEKICYHELIKIGTTFSSNNGEIDSAEGSEKINDLFPRNGGKVEFIQVNGKDAETILANNEKHKMSSLVSIPLPKPSESVFMRVEESDQVECVVRDESGVLHRRKATVSDQDIRDGNDEHYTWILDV